LNPSAAEVGGEIQATILPSPIPEPPFRLAVDFYRVDHGLRSPYTDIMAYYLLNTIPTFSPIDVMAYLRVVNRGSKEAKIEAWNLATGPSPDGPWLELVDLPQNPPQIYWAYLINRATELNPDPDFAKSLSTQSIQPMKDSGGWAFFECPSSPPCTFQYLRLTLRDLTGKEYSALENMADYNRSLQDLNSLEQHGISIKHPKQTDMSAVRLLRPYPKDLVWLAIPSRQGAAQAFGREGNPLNNKREKPRPNQSPSAYTL
jgi:hypothetical protein